MQRYIFTKGAALKIMLDNSPAVITQKEQRFDFAFWQLRTPLTRHKVSGRPYGLDNGCFSEFKSKTWARMLDEARKFPPKFVCLPDIVGDARRTLELFECFEEVTNDLPRALVLQDGIGDFSIPWHKISAVFVGGSDAFKTSPESINACRTAKILGKWVHVGRVNSVSRLDSFIGLGDSCDGSGISKYDHMLRELVIYLKNGKAQGDMFEIKTAVDHDDQLP